MNLGVNMTRRDQDTITQLLKYKPIKDRKDIKNTTNIHDLTKRSDNECLCHAHTQEDVQIIIEALVFAQGKIMNKNNTDKDQDIKRGTVKDLPMTLTSQAEKHKAPPGSSGRQKNQ